MTTTFGRLGLPIQIVDTLTRRGVTEPFPIQAAAIPDALAGRDICGMAPTGSGKTLAYGLPVLSSIDSARSGRPRGLVLVPTRELADQIVRELEPAARSMSRRIVGIYGGVGYGPQKAALRRGTDVIVATPGRLEDLMSQKWVDLGDVEIAVVDEADRMADMGFLPAVRRILDVTPHDRQTLLFSATLDDDIAVLSRGYQRDPVRHEAGSTVQENGSVTHRFWLVSHHDRTARAAEVIADEGQSIVFTRTRHGADRLAKQLKKLGVDAVALHGGRTQSQRSRALHAFSTRQASALVATDVAARGIHVDAVDVVLHFDPPGDAKDYLHRSGRTARAGAGGKVITFVTDAQHRHVRAMARELDIDPRFEPPRIKGDGNGPARPESRPDSDHERPSPRVTNDPAQSIYVANLPWRVTSDDLHALFSPFGIVNQSTIITDRKSGRSRGFGFVDMPAGAAVTAISQLHGSTLDGRDLTVRPARPRSLSVSTGRKAGYPR
jgi:superfamily II DNA/RNA helicase